MGRPKGSKNKNKKAVERILSIREDISPEGFEKIYRKYYSKFDKTIPPSGVLFLNHLERLSSKIKRIQSRKKIERYVELVFKRYYPLSTLTKKMTITQELLIRDMANYIIKEEVCPKF